MNRRLVSMLALCAAVGLAGCAQQRTAVTIDAPITAAELAPYKKRGRATIAGQASLRRQGGGAVTCARQQVLLIPAVAYNRKMIDALRAGKTPVAGPRVGSSQASWRKATCDRQGRFRFRNVPSAAWYVSIAVRWTDKEGAVIKEVLVPSVGTVKVLLTERDAIR